MLVALAAPVHAGIATTPLPKFADNKQAVMVMAVPGVVKRGRLQTDFLCTALDTAPVDIGVELFGIDGTLLNNVTIGAGAILNVAPGATVTFGTSGSAALLESQVISVASIAQGSARIVASSDKVRCNVLILDNAVTPPATMATLGEGVRPSAGAVPSSVPLPQFAPARPATHSVIVPGLVKRGRAETDVLCTSLATQNVDVGIQVFGPDGSLQNDVAVGNGAILDVAPGASVTFGTTGSLGLLESEVVAIAGVAQGMVRIISSSAQVACTAMVLDPAVTPPTSMTGLTQ
jgi:hypothetical protein